MDAIYLPVSSTPLPADRSLMESESIDVHDLFIDINRSSSDIFISSRIDREFHLSNNNNNNNNKAN